MSAAGRPEIAPSPQDMRWQKLGIALIFITFLIGIFITRGHAMLAAIAAVLLIVLAPKTELKFNIPRNSIILLALFCTLGIGLSAALSPNPEYAIFSALGACGFAIAGVILWERGAHVSQALAEKLYDYARIAVRISSTLFTLLLIYTPALMKLHPSSVAESVINRSIVAHVLLCGVYIAASLCRRQAKDGWITYIWVAAIAFMSDSETAKLAVIVAPFAYLAFMLLGAIGRYLSMVIITIYVFAAPWLAGPFFEFIKNLPAKSATFRGAFGARAEIWAGVAEMIQKNPLTGYGFESMRLIKDLPIAGIFWPAREIAHPHNGALQIWADMGIGGAALMAIAFSALIYATRRLKPQQAALTCTLIICVFLISQISHGLWQSWWLGLLGLLAFFTHVLVMEKPVCAPFVHMPEHRVEPIPQAEMQPEPPSAPTPTVAIIHEIEAMEAEVQSLLAAHVEATQPVPKKRAPRKAKPKPGSESGTHPKARVRKPRTFKVVPKNSQ